MKTPVDDNLAIHDPLADRSTCRKCACSAAPPDTIRMWDGEVYCRRCVAAKLPALLEYAEKHPVLVERFSLPAWPALRAVAISCTASAIAVLCLYRFTLGAHDQVESLLLAGLGLLAVLLLVMLPATYLRTRMISGQVAIDNGQCEMSRPNHLAAAAIKDCRWHLGFAVQAWGRSDHRRAVILSFPLSKTSHWRRSECAPCGLTDELREIWIAFFELADTPPQVSTAGRAWAWLSAKSSW